MGGEEGGGGGGGGSVYIAGLSFLGLFGNGVRWNDVGWIAYTR